MVRGKLDMGCALVGFASNFDSLGRGGPGFPFRRAETLVEDMKAVTMGEGVGDMLGHSPAKMAI